QKPLKSFKILKNKIVTDKPDSTKENKEVAFEFESNSNSIKKISTCITENKINLLCINRFENKKNKESKSLSMPVNISELINKINVPLLLMGQNNYTS
ncbi:hypothetical protein, partial [Maribacter sp.]|uniref:hypothetical protein n=1 Tax=Maribacter sp. TaxID=1897614 RepID=UPI003297920C